MPFTFAHPAAILPLRRFRFLLTVPLIIGSLVPDVPYFFPYGVGRLLSDTHSLYGSFAICLPLGLAVLLATLLLREPLTVLLSARTRWICLRSIERFTERPLHWPIAVLSILVGAWTHIAWDSFTHPAGWTALRVAALNAPVTIFGWDTELSHLLQYVSSVFGLVVLAIWFRRLLSHVREPSEGDPTHSKAEWPLLLITCAGAVLIGGLRAVMLWHMGSYYRLGFLLLTRIIGWFITLYLAAGVAVMLHRRFVPEATD